MNFNYNTNNLKSPDYGTRNVLDMPGSIINYVNTGNPLKSDAEFIGDTFLSDKRHKRNSIIKKVLIGAGAVAAGIGAIFALKNRGKFKKLKFNKANFSKLKEKVSDFGNKLKGKIFKNKVTPSTDITPSDDIIDGTYRIISPDTPK